MTKTKPTTVAAVRGDFPQTVAPEVPKVSTSHAGRVVLSTFASPYNPRVISQQAITDDDLCQWLARPTRWTGLWHRGFSLAVFSPRYRAIANVDFSSAVVMDYDKGGTRKRLNDIWCGFSGAVYTTRSHVHPAKGERWRAILFVTHPMSPEESDAVWLWADARSKDANIVADPACKDASRYWYQPTTPPGGFEFERLLGAPLDVDAIVAEVRSKQEQNIPARPAPTRVFRVLNGQLDLDRLHATNQQSLLARLSGHPIVHGERYSFRRVSNGNHNIVVNGKPTSCFIDRQGRIGSLSGGGPSVYQWVRWFGHDARSAIAVLRDVFPEFVATAGASL